MVTAGIFGGLSDNDGEVEEEAEQMCGEYYYIVVVRQDKDID